MTGAIAVVIALGAEHEAIKSFILTNRMDLVPTPRQHLVHVGLMADVENELILRGVEDTVQRDRELNNAKIRAEVTAGLGE